MAGPQVGFSRLEHMQLAEVGYIRLQFPAISIAKALRYYRDHRDKPGDD